MDVNIKRIWKGEANGHTYVQLEGHDEDGIDQYEFENDDQRDEWLKEYAPQPTSKREAVATVLQEHIKTDPALSDTTAITGKTLTVEEPKVSEKGAVVGGQK